MDLANSFMKEFPADAVALQMDVDTWVSESFYLAKGFIYPSNFLR